MKHLWPTIPLLLVALLGAAPATVPTTAATRPLDAEALRLAEEVRELGWIVFSARSASGDFDLFVARPDGSQLHQITRTPDFDELGPRLSPDGTKLMYRRLARGTRVDHVHWGSFGSLMIADADGSNPRPLGRDGQYPYATWGPDSAHIACLYRREGRIRVFDLEGGKPLLERPRLGIIRQLVWSPDGRSWIGSAELDGLDWNIVLIDIETGWRRLLSRGLACTPDFIPPDGIDVLYSCGNGQERDGGWVVLMRADTHGLSRELVYAERGRHIYYGCGSPDGRYVIFSRRERNMGAIEGPMAIVRLADAPIIVPGGSRFDQMMRAEFGEARPGPVLHLSALAPGFEPHWTAADAGPSSSTPDEAPTTKPGERPAETELDG